MEINQEALKNLTVADISSLLTLCKMYPSFFTLECNTIIELHAELHKKVSNVFPN